MWRVSSRIKKLLGASEEVQQGDEEPGSIGAEVEQWRNVDTSGRTSWEDVSEERIKGTLGAGRKIGSLA